MNFTINPPRAPLVDGAGRVTPEWYRFLCRTQNVGEGAYLTVEKSTALSSQRVVEVIAGELTTNDGGPGQTYTFGLADTAVVPGPYGDASHTISVSVDGKGRLTAVASHALDSDNVTEGATNLYFTNARARTAISDGAGLDYDNITGVISAHPAGTYGAPTGTLSRSSFATYTAPTVSATYAASELQAVADALQVQTRILAALITDLQANGNLA